MNFRLLYVTLITHLEVQILQRAAPKAALVKIDEREQTTRAGSGSLTG